MFQKLVLLSLLYLPTTMSIESMIDISEEFYREHYALKYIFLFCGMVLVAIIRHATREHDFLVPYPVLSIGIGLLWGIGALYSEWMHLVSAFAYPALLALDYYYLPVITFSTAFCIDVHAFFTCFTQILIVSGPIAILSAVTTGMIMKLVINPEGWDVVDGILFGVIMLPIYPLEVLLCLKESTTHTRHVKILLEGETLISLLTTLTMYEFLTGYITGWVVRWYQFTMNVVRQIAIGLPLAYFLGFSGSFLMKVVYNDAVGSMLVTLIMCYSSYYYVRVLANSGVLGSALVGIIMGSKRTSLTQEMDKTLVSMWKAIASILSGVVFLILGVVTPKVLGEGIQLDEYILVLVTYLLSNMARFLCFFVFSLVLSRIGYGMTFQNMVMCVWGALKNPICLYMAGDLFEGVYAKDEHKARVFFLHAAAVYFLLMFINGTSATLVIKALGFSELSLSRQMNMNNCMKYIYEARARTIAILKMDRFLSDANWPLVMQSTALKHPYKKKSQEEILQSHDEDEEDYFLGHKFTFCPDCQRNILNEPTPRELRDMTREVKLRLLKLKKTAYSRLFENGMMSKVGIQILHHAVEVAMDSEELVIELDGLFRLFSKEGIYYRVMRNVLRHFLKEKYENLLPPRLWWRRVCYHIVITHGDIFMTVINTIVLLQVVVIVYDMTQGTYFSYLVVLYTTFACTPVYFVEFWLKIFALSWILVFEHGVRNYFRSYWNIIEFAVLCYCFLCIFGYALIKTRVIPPLGVFVFALPMILLLLTRLLRGLTLLKYLECCKSFTPAMIRYLEAQIDMYRALAYELGKNYLAAEEEILENLHQIVDNDKIREEIKAQINIDRLAITRKLGIAQKESPHVATTVKTKLTMSTVLNSMKDDVHELKVGGWVDDVENTKLLKSLGERYKFISSMKTIQPVSSKLIFREIPYMGDADKVVEFLYNNVLTKRFMEGEDVYKEGDVADSIYVVISGMLKVTYTPREQILEKLHDFGVLPIADYIISVTYEEPSIGYVVPGNTIGELSLLTARAYNGVVTAETTTTVYALNKDILTKAFEMDVDPVNGLECRMWKILSFRRALTVMLNTPSYRSYTQDKIKYILERSFMPNLSNYKIFVVNEMMVDIILIEGVVVDFNSRDIYTGPCYIPRAVQKLILPKSSFINMQVPVETRLLVIPAKDYNEYEIMVTEEQICELVNDESNKCLRHLIQEEGFLKDKFPNLDDRGIKAIISATQRKIMGIDSTSTKKSNISVVKSNISTKKSNLSAIKSNISTKKSNLSAIKSNVSQASNRRMSILKVRKDV